METAEKTTKCKHCKLDIPQDATACGHCGRSQDTSVGCLVVICLLGGLVFLPFFPPLGIISIGLGVVMMIMALFK